MSKPAIAIVERPSAGESMLFSVITGNTISIVEDTPGVTRDRVYTDCNWLDMSPTLTDTGGIEPDVRDVILSQMREQAEITISTADVIIFIVDVRQGLVDSDAKVVDILRKSHEPVVPAVNKVDSATKFGNDAFEFHNLGIGDPVPVSVTPRLGIDDLLDEMVRHFDGTQVEEEDDDRPHIAVMGKSNIGKSSIVNKLLGENWVIISDITGTTRDAVDTEIIRNDTPHVSIGTAGLRRKNKIREGLEQYSTVRTATTVERVDIVVIVTNTTGSVTEQDAKIAGAAHERGRGMIVAVNKRDAIEKTGKIIYEYVNKIKNTLSFIPYAEYIFVSTQIGQRLPELFELVDAVCQNQALRVATGVLNEIMTEAVTMQQPPPDRGRRLKTYYTTQVTAKPPIFMIFVNDKELMRFSHTRYPENQTENVFGFKGASLKFTARERKAKRQ